LWTCTRYARVAHKPVLQVEQRRFQRGTVFENARVCQIIVA
jgi:hypothetical protein